MLSLATGCNKDCAGSPGLSCLRIGIAQERCNSPKPLRNAPRVAGALTLLHCKKRVFYPFNAFYARGLLSKTRGFPPTRCDFAHYSCKKKSIGVIPTSVS